VTKNGRKYGVKWEFVTILRTFYNCQDLFMINLGQFYDQFRTISKCQDHFRTIFMIILGHFGSF